MKPRRDDTASFVTLEVAGERWAIAVEHVLEVVREAPLTRLPLAPPAVAGVIALRGHIVPAIDLARALQLPSRGTRTPLHLLVRHGEASASLLVDTVGDLVRVPLHAIVPPPGTLDPARRSSLAGVAALPDGLIALLDLGRTLATAFAAAPTPVPLSTVPEATP